MDTKFADAINAFNDEVSAACARANRMDINDGTLVQELRRIADEMEREVQRQMKRNRDR